MKLMVRLAVLFYRTTLLLLGCFIILFVFNVITIGDVTDVLARFYADDEWRLVAGILAGIMLVFNLFFSRAILNYHQKERTIAFDNPSGRVSVSLTAVEDLIRRVILRGPEVKDVRSEVRARKGRIEIDSRLVLRSDVNIPEMTNRLQELVRRKIQETVGLDETVIVRVHVMKIIADEAKDKKGKGDNWPDDSEQPMIPFQGYRA